MPAPTAEQCATYLATQGQTWAPDDVASAFAAELAAQGRVCRQPDPTAAPPEAPVPDWPADLVEALFRRVAHNLALRALPLGVQANMTEAAVATTRVGGTDAEVRRLEAPYRKLPLG